MWFDDGLEATDLANRTALLLAQDRYSSQFAPFVKNSKARLSYVESQIDRMLSEVVEETGADLEHVKARFDAFIADVVLNPTFGERQELEYQGEAVRETTGNPLEGVKKTDVAERGDVEGAGLEEALKPGARVSLSHLVGKKLTPRTVARLKKRADRSDYEHWNEDRDYMWWMEEGRHPHEPPEPDYEEDLRAEDAAWEELYDWMHDQPPDVLHDIIEDKPLGFTYPYAEHFDYQRVKALAQDVLDEAGDPYEFAERTIRGGSTKEGQGNFALDGTGMGTGTGLADPADSAVSPVQEDLPHMCDICKAFQGTRDEVLAHVQQDHADVLQRMQQQQMGQSVPAVAKIAEEEPAKVEPLPRTPADQFDDLVQQLANRAAAEQFSAIDDETVHAIASQLGLGEQEIRDNLVTVAIFGDYIGTNGRLGKDATPPEGYEEVSIEGHTGRIEPHEAIVPTNALIAKVAEDNNMEQNLTYTMIRDRYGADLPEKWHASVNGEHHYYLPSEMAMNQTQEPQPTDPEVGPTPQPLDQGGAVPTPPLTRMRY